MVLSKGLVVDIDHIKGKRRWQLKCAPENWVYSLGLAMTPP